MGKLTAAGKQFLAREFGERANLQRVERKLYGHDIAAMPSLVKPLVGNTTPEAVVQPQSEADLVKIVQWAVKHKIPLTPRGKGTSGYGGVLPVKKGVVIDFHRMNRLIEVDKANMTATMQAGIVWEKLDAGLSKEGLAVKLYPSSYPGSTVGGWLAQGGAGIGSYEAGWFRDNIVSARIVQPDGEIGIFSGDELALVNDAEGITGLISELTMKVQPLEDLEIIAVATPEAHELQNFISHLVKEELPIWSLLFINPKMAELKNEAPLMEHLGHRVHDKVLLPAAYIVTIAFRKKDSLTVHRKLPELLQEHYCELMSEEIAHHEWENRFKIMVVKRLGPSLVPVEVVIPLEKLGDFMAEVNKKVYQPVVKEGVIIRQGFNGWPEVVILGFIPSDQRKLSYNFVFPLALTMFKIAEKCGGRPYASGLYFSAKTSKILGIDRVRRLQEFKARTDPHNIMNPGKVVQRAAISRFLGMASSIEPVLRPFGNRIRTHIGERPVKPIRGIPADIAWYAYGCSQCGYCVEECDQYYGRGWESQSPRGKWYWLREYMEGREKWDQFQVDTILSCTTCELCNKRCSAQLPIEQSWGKLRGQLIDEKRKMTFPPFEMMAAALRKEGDIWAGYRKDRTAWFPEDLKMKHGPQHKASSVYFAGCTASYVEKDIALASVRLLDAAGVDFTYLGEKENCCATPMLVAGKWDVFKETMKKNIAAVQESGADTVITSCPACDMMWRHVYPQWSKKLGIEYDIKTRHYSEILSEKIRSGQFTIPRDGHAPCTVTWHDSCHMGRVSGVYEPPRELIKALPDVKLVEMKANREKAHCCGSVLTLIKEPEIAADVGKVRLDEAKDAGAEKVIALCPCCEFQLRVSADKKQLPMEVVDLARFAASYLGYEFPDPNPEVQKQWAVFEAMITLMTPQGFADIMKSMWPEMIAAMPFKMGIMMRAMGKVPGALNLMKPAFPVLFPRLLPLMMPKLMPVMLEKVRDRIPMPDYMEEQMPDLMPKVMDGLMPHMIGDVVPLVTQPMIDYLTGKTK